MSNHVHVLPQSSDLVRDSRLSTAFLADGSTKHVRYRSSKTSRQRKLREDEVWRRSRPLGNGTFGQVHLEQCCHHTDQTKRGQLRAVKEIAKSMPGVVAMDYSRELEAIAKFSHEKYVRCFVESFGWFETDDAVFIAMEYVEYGDLQKHLGRPLPEVEAKEIVAQIAEGIDFMHQNNFAHRDLKPQNILVCMPAPNWWVKIGDFGISKRADTTDLHTNVGTKAYKAPELQGIVPNPSDLASSSLPAYTFAVDVWALGEMSFRMLTQRAAFPEVLLLARYVQVAPEPFPAGPLLRHRASAECRDFVARCMAKSARDRPSSRQVVDHPWIRQLEETQDTMGLPPTMQRMPPSSVVGAPDVVVVVGGPADEGAGSAYGHYTTAPEEQASNRWDTLPAGSTDLTSTSDPGPRRAQQPTNPPTGLASGRSPPPAAARPVLVRAPPPLVPPKPTKLASKSSSTSLVPSQPPAVTVVPVVSAPVPSPMQHAPPPPASPLSPTITVSPVPPSAARLSALPVLPSSHLSKRHSAIGLRISTSTSASSPPSPYPSLSSSATTSLSRPLARHRSTASLRDGPTYQPHHHQPHRSADAGTPYPEDDDSLLSDVASARGFLLPRRPRAPDSLALPYQAPPPSATTAAESPPVPPKERLLPDGWGGTANNNLQDLGFSPLEPAEARFFAPAPAAAAQEIKLRRAQQHQQHQRAAQWAPQHFVNQAEGRKLVRPLGPGPAGPGTPTTSPVINTPVIRRPCESLERVVLALVVAGRALATRRLRRRFGVFELNGLNAVGADAIVSPGPAGESSATVYGGLDDTTAADALLAPPLTPAAWAHDGPVDWAAGVDVAVAARRALYARRPHRFASDVTGKKYTLGSRQFQGQGSVSQSVRQVRVAATMGAAGAGEDRFFAVKTYGDRRTYPLLHRELRCLLRLNHAGIARLHDVVVAATTRGSEGDGDAADNGSPLFGLVVDTYGFLDVFEYMAAPELAVNFSRVVVFKQLLAAVAHLQDRGLAHSRIGPRTVLIKGDGRRARVKLVDFEHWQPIGPWTEAVPFADGVDTVWERGSYRYLPPETWLYGVHTATKHSDVWSCGMVMCELLGPLPQDALPPPSGSAPQQCQKVGDLKNNLKRILNPFLDALRTNDSRPTRAGGFTDTEADVLQGMMRLRPAKRSSVREAYFRFFGEYLPRSGAATLPSATSPRPQLGAQIHQQTWPPDVKRGGVAAEESARPSPGLFTDPPVAAADAAVRIRPPNQQPPRREEAEWMLQPQYRLDAPRRDASSSSSSSAPSLSRSRSLQEVRPPQGHAHSRSHGGAGVGAAEAAAFRAGFAGGAGGVNKDNNNAPARPPLQRPLRPQRWLPADLETGGADAYLVTTPHSAGGTGAGAGAEASSAGGNSTTTPAGAGPTRGGMLGLGLGLGLGLPSFDSSAATMPISPPPPYQAVAPSSSLQPPPQQPVDYLQAKALHRPVAVVTAVEPVEVNSTTPPPGAVASTASTATTTAPSVQPVDAAPGASNRPALAPGVAPPGWVAHWDFSAKRYLYIYRSTGQGQWEQPVA